MRGVSVCVLAAAVAMGWIGVARAQSARPAVFAAASAANAKKMSVQQREEWRFLKEAAASSRFEGEASRMAMTRSDDPDVRFFAATLVNHHAATAIALQHMLHRRGMAPPMLANDQRKTLNRLGKLSGARFDREYTEQVGLKYLQADLREYERAATSMQDPVLKAWVVRTLPTLRNHLASAERLAGSGEAAPIKVRMPRSRTASPLVRQATTAAWPTESSTR